MKRVTSVSDYDAARLTDDAYNRFNNVPYYPPGVRKIGVGDFASNNRAVKTWADKTDYSSMSCGKLVWNTYWPKVDLDSNRTLTAVFDWQSGGPVRVRIPFVSWNGVSPDDVYYSDKLSPDLAWQATINWQRPFAGDM